MKSKATYTRMTNYNTLVFTFFWYDVAKQLAIVHKQVQETNIQTLYVGRVITFLCTHLTENYLLDSKMPEKFPLADGFGTHIMNQFWGQHYYASMAAPSF